VGDSLKFVTSSSLKFGFTSVKIVWRLVVCNDEVVEAAVKAEAACKAEIDGMLETARAKAETASKAVCTSGPTLHARKVRRVRRARRVVSSEEAIRGALFHHYGWCTCGVY